MRTQNCERSSPPFWAVEITDQLGVKNGAHWAWTASLDDAGVYLEQVGIAVELRDEWEADTKTDPAESKVYTLGEGKVYLIERSGKPNPAWATLLHKEAK